jgi:hypothetical protein
LKYLRQQVLSSLVIQSWHAAMDGCIGEASAQAIDLRSDNVPDALTETSWIEVSANW